MTDILNGTRLNILLLEKGGVAAYMYKDVADEIFQWIQQQVENINDLEKLEKTKLSVPKSLTSKISLYNNLEINIEFELVNNKTFGHGGSDIDPNDTVSLGGRLNKGHIDITVYDDCSRKPTVLIVG